MVAAADSGAAAGGVLGESVDDPMTYAVLVDESRPHGRKMDRYAHGTFDTLDAAIRAAKRIVDDYLDAAYEPGMSGQRLWQIYVMFGDDPFIASEELTVSPFSAWSYASERIRSWNVRPPSGTADAPLGRLPR